MPVFIDSRICDNQDVCDVKKICPSNAVSLDKKEGMIIDRAKCTGCLLCLKACPYLAVKLAKDENELAEFKKKLKRAKLDRRAHIAKIYGTKLGRVGGIQLKDSNFRKKVDSKVPTLVIFWGAHSGVMAPLLREAGRRHRDKLRIAYVRFADNPKTSKKYAIATTPTLVLFREGKEIGRLEGIRHRETLRVWIETKLKPSPS